jgi:hypothetical protein
VRTTSETRNNGSEGVKELYVQVHGDLTNSSHMYGSKHSRSLIRFQNGRNDGKKSK